MAKDAKDSDVASDLTLAGAWLKKNSSSPANVKRSAEPKNKYCKAIQKKDMGNGFGESIRPDSVATRLRLISTWAATAMAMIDSRSPTPMRCKCDIPISVLVTLLAKGMMIWS